LLQLFGKTPPAPHQIGRCRDLVRGAVFCFSKGDLSRRSIAKTEAIEFNADNLVQKFTSETGCGFEFRAIVIAVEIKKVSVLSP
jgi:hypothetical protein